MPVKPCVDDFDAFPACADRRVKDWEREKICDMRTNAHLNIFCRKKMFVPPIRTFQKNVAIEKFFSYIRNVERG